MCEKALAENLKALRKKHAFTQQSLSSYLNVSRQCYSQYECGSRTPTAATLIRLASLYRVSLDYLFYFPSQHRSDNPVNNYVKELKS